MRMMLDASVRKLALPPRDLMIRGALSGALLGAATTLAFTGAVDPFAIAPGYFEVPESGDGALAYSAVSDDFADAYTGAHTAATGLIGAGDRERRPFGLVGSVFAAIFIVRMLMQKRGAEPQRMQYAAAGSQGAYSDRPAASITPVPQRGQVVRGAARGAALGSVGGAIAGNAGLGPRRARRWVGWPAECAVANRRSSRVINSKPPLSPRAAHSKANATPTSERWPRASAGSLKRRR